MSVGRICTRVTHTAAGDESVRQAARRMAEHHVGTVVVVDEASRPIGMRTDRDIGSPRGAGPGPERDHQRGDHVEAGLHACRGRRLDMLQQTCRGHEGVANGLDLL